VRITWITEKMQPFCEPTKQNGCHTSNSSRSHSFNTEILMADALRAYKRGCLLKDCIFAAKFVLTTWR